MTDETRDLPLSDPGPDAAPLAPVVLTGPQERISAGAVRVERGGVDQVTADAVEVKLGGIGRVNADEVFVQWGGIGAARTDSLSVEFGSAGATLAGTARISQGFANTIVARDVTVEQGLVRTLIGGRVSISRPSAVAVLIAFKVDGDVRTRPLLDWRGALAAAGAIALVSGGFKLLRRLLEARED